MDSRILHSMNTSDLSDRIHDLPDSPTIPKSYDSFARDIATPRSPSAGPITSSPPGPLTRRSPLHLSARSSPVIIKRSHPRRRSVKFRKDMPSFTELRHFLLGPSPVRETPVIHQRSPVLEKPTSTPGEVNPFLGRTMRPPHHRIPSPERLTHPSRPRSITPERSIHSASPERLKQIPSSLRPVAPTVHRSPSPSRIPKLTYPRTPSPARLLESRIPSPVRTSLSPHQRAISPVVAGQSLERPTQRARQPSGDTIFSPIRSTLSPEQRTTPSPIRPSQLRAPQQPVVPSQSPIGAQKSPKQITQQAAQKKTKRRLFGTPSPVKPEVVTASPPLAQGFATGIPRLSPKPSPQRQITTTATDPTVKYFHASPGVVPQIIVTGDSFIVDEDVPPEFRAPIDMFAMEDMWHPGELEGIPQEEASFYSLFSNDKNYTFSLNYLYSLSYPRLGTPSSTFSPRCILSVTNLIKIR